MMHHFFLTWEVLAVPIYINQKSNYNFNTASHKMATQNDTNDEISDKTPYSTYEV